MTKNSIWRMNYARVNICWYLLGFLTKLSYHNYIKSKFNHIITKIYDKLRREVFHILWLIGIHIDTNTILFCFIVIFSISQVQYIFILRGIYTTKLSFILFVLHEHIYTNVFIYINLAFAYNVWRYIGKYKHSCLWAAQDKHLKNT